MTDRSWSRVVLGTVQLGLPYGRRRNDGLMPWREVAAILDRAWELGIRAFDTAEAYGEAADRLARWLGERDRWADVAVVTKVKPGAELARRAETALERFGGAARRAILTHGFVPSVEVPELAAAANRAGAGWGQSVYGSEEVGAAMRDGAGIVQAPANVFDRGAIEARGRSTVRLDLRSAYLQGVLLETPAEAESRAPGCGPLAAAVHAAAAEVAQPAAPLLLAAMLDASGRHDRVVVGADDPSQLDVIAPALALSPDAVRTFAERAVALGGPVRAGVTDPRRWS